MKTLSANLHFILTVNNIQICYFKEIVLFSIIMKNIYLQVHKIKKNVLSHITK